MTPQSVSPAVYYEQIDEHLYRSTDHAQGAWAADQQHMSPVSGLLMHVIDQCNPRPELMTSRITFDILGVIPAGDVEVRASVLRPGRTIELVEATMVASGRTVVRATAWRLLRSDSDTIAATPLAAMPGPESARPWQGSTVWDGGFIRSVQFKIVPGWQPGRGGAWLRTDVALLESTVHVSPLARYIGLVDTSNGVASRADPRTLLFPNTDLSIHLFREPVGEWVGLDASVSFGPSGVGLTAAVLHDEQGPIGRAAQTLTLRALGSMADVRPPEHRW